MKQRPARRAGIAGVLGAALAVGCAAAPAPPARSSAGAALKPPASTVLPEYGRPRGELLPPTEIPPGDLVPYRTLTREDFRAADPPPEIAPHRDRLGAYTCGRIRAVARARFRIEAIPSGREHRFRATPDRLAFEALMDRSCSWWNERQSTLPEWYVLDHEQIHFALFELRARRMTLRAEEIAAATSALGPTPEAAVESAQGALNEAMRRELEEALAVHLRFDEETSNAFRPEVQRSWRERVDGELAAASVSQRSE